MSVASIASVGLLAGVIGISSVGYLAPATGGGGVPVDVGRGGGRVTFGPKHYGIARQTFRAPVKVAIPAHYEEDEETAIITAVVAAAMRYYT